MEAQFGVVQIAATPARKLERQIRRKADAARPLPLALVEQFNLAAVAFPPRGIAVIERECEHQPFLVVDAFERGLDNPMIRPVGAEIGVDTPRQLREFAQRLADTRPDDGLIRK